MVEQQFNQNVDLIQQFEGPEKKLEILLYSAVSGLRENIDNRWNQVVHQSGAKIISTISSGDMDAYLLSESSLFVWEDRILMITCGKTTLVNAIPEILSFIKKDQIALVFYERKNFMFPGEQPSNFEEDVSDLENYFQGKSYRLGPANHDHVHVFFSSHYQITPNQDVTLQLLMSDLNPDSAAPFCVGSANACMEIAHQSGLNQLYKDMQLDSHLFSPYGFSLNGIRGKEYFTVHVTPQPLNSYASFETNVLKTDFTALIQKIVSIFKPKKYSLVLTTSMDLESLALHSTMVNAVQCYSISEKSSYEFDCGYAVTFLNHSLK